MKDRPKVGVGSFIFKDGKLLLGKRISKNGSGTWSPPGGHLEFGEEPVECAIRETMEEVGIEIINSRIFAMTNDIYRNEGKHYLSVHVISDYYSGVVSISEEESFSEWRWFAENEMPDPLFLPLINLKNNSSSPFKFIKYVGQPFIQPNEPARSGA